MSKVRRLQILMMGAAFLWAAVIASAADDAQREAGRIEARAKDFLAVGLVHGDKLTLHVSHTVDNSPVHDAVIAVVLRGSVHPAVAEADGSYTLQTPDLALPGAAVVEFQVTEGSVEQTLKGTVEVAGTASKPEDSNNARQLWWWVLNFAVCIGFLWLFSRRKAAAED